MSVKCALYSGLSDKISTCISSEIVFATTVQIKQVSRGFGKLDEGKGPDSVPSSPHSLL